MRKAGDFIGNGAGNGIAAMEWTARRASGCATGAAPRLYTTHGVQALYVVGRAAAPWRRCVKERAEAASLTYITRREYAGAYRA
jgi:hypothetical protein